MIQLAKALRSSKTDISHQVGVLFTGKTTSKLVKKIKFHPSIGNSSILLEHHKLRKHQVFLVLMESSQMELFKENSVIVGS
jgi:hypothetical protein